MLSSLNYAESIEISSVGFYCLCLPLASPSAMCIVYTAVKQKKAKTKTKIAGIQRIHSFSINLPRKEERRWQTVFSLKVVARIGLIVLG